MGISTFPATLPNSTVCTIAAKGPTALATSFAPCANDSRAAERTSGMANNLLIDLLNFRAGDQKYTWDYFFVNPIRE